MASNETNKEKPVRLSINQANDISDSNIDIVLEGTVVRFNSLREDKQTNQGKAQFVLAIVGASLALLIAEIVTPLRTEVMLRAYLFAHTVILCGIGSLLVWHCMLPTHWRIGGLSISDIWREEWIRNLGPKPFKVYLAQYYEERIDFNKKANENAVTWLQRLTLLLFLSPLLATGLAFIVWCLSHLDCF